jgi:hypothetical protein
VAVSPEDRRRFERQVAALRDGETEDEGTPASRAAAIEDADRWRAEHGIPPLDTEAELHRRARDLGLLRR